MTAVAAGFRVNSNRTMSFFTEVSVIAHNVTLIM